jgi:hypothetical protein
MSVRIYGGETADGEAVFRLEPRPSPTWRALFEDGLEDALGGRVSLDGDRLLVSVKRSMIHEGRLNGYWTGAIALLVGATNTEWKRLRDTPPADR